MTDALNISLPRFQLSFTSSTNSFVAPPLLNFTTSAATTPTGAPTPPATVLSTAQTDFRSSLTRASVGGGQSNLESSSSLPSPANARPSLCRMFGLLDVTPSQSSPSSLSAPQVELDGLLSPTGTGGGTSPAGHATNRHSEAMLPEHRRSATMMAAKPPGAQAPLVSRVRSGRRLMDYSTQSKNSLQELLDSVSDFDELPKSSSTSSLSRATGPAPPPRANLRDEPPPPPPPLRSVTGPATRPASLSNESVPGTPGDGPMQIPLDGRGHVTIVTPTAQFTVDTSAGHVTITPLPGGTAGGAQPAGPPAVAGNSHPLGRPSAVAPAPTKSRLCAIVAPRERRAGSVSGSDGEVDGDDDQAGGEKTCWGTLDRNHTGGGVDRSDVDSEEEGVALRGCVRVTGIENLIANRDALPKRDLSYRGINDEDVANNPYRYDDDGEDGPSTAAPHEHGGGGHDVAGFSSLPHPHHHHSGGDPLDVGQAAAAAGFTSLPQPLNHRSPAGRRPLRPFVAALPASGSPRHRPDPLATARSMDHPSERHSWSGAREGMIHHPPGPLRHPVPYQPPQPHHNGGGIQSFYNPGGSSVMHHSSSDGAFPHAPPGAIHGHSGGGGGGGGRHTPPARPSGDGAYHTPSGRHTSPHRPSGDGGLSDWNNHHGGGTASNAAYYGGANMSDAGGGYGGGGGDAFGRGRVPGYTGRDCPDDNSLDEYDELSQMAQPDQPTRGDRNGVGALGKATTKPLLGFEPTLQAPQAGRELKPQVSSLTRANIEALNSGRVGGGLEDVRPASGARELQRFTSMPQRRMHDWSSPGAAAAAGGAVAAVDEAISPTAGNSSRKSLPPGLQRLVTMAREGRSGPSAPSPVKAMAVFSSDLNASRNARVSIASGISGGGGVVDDDAPVPTGHREIRHSPSFSHPTQRSAWTERRPHLSLKAAVHAAVVLPRISAAPRGSFMGSSSGGGGGGGRDRRDSEAGGMEEGHYY